MTRGMSERREIREMKEGGWSGTPFSATQLQSQSWIGKLLHRERRYRCFKLNMIITKLLLSLCFFFFFTENLS